MGQLQEFALSVRQAAEAHPAATTTRPDACRGEDLMRHLSCVVTALSALAVKTQSLCVAGLLVATVLSTSAVADPLGTGAILLNTDLSNWCAQITMDNTPYIVSGTP